MIPEMVYDFTLFDDVLTGSANPDYLIDVIRELVDVLQWSLDGKPKKVVFTMKDKWYFRSFGIIVNCTLWEDFAFLLKDYLDKHENVPVILLLHLEKIKETQGAYGVSIQNSMYGSRLFTNEDLKDIEDYKNGQRLSQISYSSQPTSEDRFLYNAQVKLLSELCELKKECVCVTVATINKFLVGNGWIYESCPKCNKKVKCDKFSYTYQCCGNESATIVARFRLEVRVGQPNETTNFTLWDCECSVLIKERASDIKQQMIDEEGEFDSKDIPEAIDRILGKKLAFRFKAIPNNTRYSMSQISEDEDLIMLLLKRLPTYELARIELEMSDSSVKHGDDIAYIQSLLAIGDFDHESSKSVTPAKRGFMISESQLESVPFEDLSLIQLSCSKLSKHIKS
ncbi:hypothetical protein GmHk_16G046736 [Glycine max]|nr:hypothetical protein GmHk_16G046736 [Glycine max]